MVGQRMADEKYRAPALDKGLDILEFLSGQPNGVTRAEIVKAIGRSPGEIYRMLERLVARDYVRRSPGGDRYALSMKLFVLGSHHPPIRRFVSDAQPLMDAFADRMAQSVHLVVPEGALGIVVAQATGVSNWEFRLRIGARLDLTRTSSGQTLLAFMTSEQRLVGLAADRTGEAARRAEGLEPALAAIRRTGHRIGESLQLAGVKDISVPVFGPGDEAMAVLTCPYLRHVDEPTAEIDPTLQALRAVADALSIR